MTTARVEAIAQGTTLYRVGNLKFGLSYKREAPPPHGGGRFDCVDGSYGYSYFADDPGVALAEVFSRNLSPSRSVRTIQAAKFGEAVLMTVETIAEFEVQLLHGNHLTFIGHDVSLTKSDPSNYDETRKVAAELIADHPTAQGLRYRPRHDEDGFAYMLYAKSAVLELSDLVSRQGEDIPLGTDDGLALATTLLAQYNVAVER